MKIMSKIRSAFIATAFVLITVASVSYGQTTVPLSLPIGNKGMLRAHALEQVSGGNMSIWGESMIWSDKSVTWMYFNPATPPTADEVLQELYSTWFSFKVMDKSKPLNVWAALHNSSGQPLFSGYANASVSESGDIVCSGVPMKMSNFIPIYVGEDVQSAYVRTTENWQSVSVQNGWAFFPSDYTEKDGVFVLQKLEEDIGYSLKTGVQMPQISVFGTVNTWLDDYRSFYADKTQLGTLYVNMDRCYVGGGHEVPVASIKISDSPRSARFLVTIYNLDNTLAEKPVQGWIFKKGSDTETPVSLTPVLPGEWSAPITLEPGEWFFYPETTLFETPAPVVIGR